MNKSFEEILNNINNLTDENYIDTLKSIINNENQKEKTILFNEFVKKVKKMAIYYEYDSESKLKEAVESISDNLKELDLELERILIDNNFNFDSIKEERSNLGITYKDELINDNVETSTTDKKEIEIITKEIEEIQDKYIEMFTKEYLIEELAILKEQINDLLNSNKSELDKSRKNNLQNDLFNIENDLAILTKSDKNLTEDEIIELTNKYNINLKQLLNKTKKKINDIKLLTKEIENLTKELEETNDLLNNNYEKKYEDMSLKELEEALNKLKEEREKLLLDQDWTYQEWRYNNTKTIEDSAKLNNKADSMDNEIDIIERKIKVEKELTEKNKISKDLNKLIDLKYIKSTYNSIYKEAVMEFENIKNPNKISEKVDKFINNHLRINKLNNYEKSEKIKNELYKDIIDVVKPKKVDKKIKQPKLWAKALVGAAGFAAGLGASCIPGVGAIKMGLFGLHLLHEGAEIYADAFKESKITKLYNEVKENYQNSIVAKAYEKLRSKPLVRIALGGFTVGYIAGNVYELIKGETLLETLKDDTPKINPGDIAIDEPVTEDSIIEEKPIVEEKPVIEETPVVEDIPIIEEVPTIEPITPQPGEKFDLSSLLMGYGSPDAENMVNLMESLGKEVVFDKALELPNGKIMWHFKRLNGAGYAWFDSEVVQELLSNQINAISKVGR